MHYLSLGGRLRAYDPIASCEATIQRAASDIAVYTTDARDWEPTAKERAVLHAFRAIVARGARPPVDPRAEEQLLRKAGLWESTMPGPRGTMHRTLSESPWPSGEDHIVRQTVTWRERFEFDTRARLHNGQNLLHGDAERPFFLEWVPANIGSDVGHWVHPQASIASILGQSAGDERVDFLLAHPFSPSLVVEIDGRQHDQVAAADSARDAELASHGIDTLRVPASDVVNKRGPRLDELRERWRSAREEPAAPGARERLLVWGPAIIQRIAYAISCALEAGWLCGPTWRLAVEEPCGLATDAVSSAADLLGAISDIWGASIAPETIILRAGSVHTTIRRDDDHAFVVVPHARDDVSGADDVVVLIEPYRGPFHVLPFLDDIPRVVVRSTFAPFPLTESRLGGARRAVLDDETSAPSWALRRVLHFAFAKQDFMPEGPEPRAQERAIRRLLAGQDTVVLLPTGAGKSLTYQFAGLLLPGLTLVIDPIVSLIDDQLEGLAANGIDRAIGLTSRDTKEGGGDALLRRVRAGEVEFAFVAPERLQSEGFRQALRSLSVASPISLVVVDEAHCVSEWGHDFRTSYLDLGRILRTVCADVEGKAPALLALTGTASRSVLKDMLTELSIDRSDPAAVISPEHFDRPELHFHVVKSTTDDPTATLLGTLRSIPSAFGGAARTKSLTDLLAPRGGTSVAGIIFCSTVRAPKTGLRDVAAAIEKEFALATVTYSGRPASGEKDAGHDADKRRNAARFKRNEATVMIATKAYGMGIDKPNVRFIIHVGVSGSIEAYYQEAGRAGRDRRTAHCWIVHYPKATEVHDFFHGRSFRGEASDVNDVNELLKELAPIGTERTVVISWTNDDHKSRLEKAIHRLKLLGVVRDYLVSWGSRRFTVMLAVTTPELVDQALLTFVRRNQPGRVQQFARVLQESPPTDLTARVKANAVHMIEYVYQSIGEARKRAVKEMDLLAQGVDDDRVIRDRILRYLDLGAVARQVEELVDHEPFRFTEWIELYSTIQTLEDARDWRGATARLLESQPDHPGLLLGRGLAETLLRDGSDNVFLESITDAIQSAGTRFTVPSEEIVLVCEWLFAWTRERRPRWASLIYLALEGVEVDGVDEALDRVERAYLQDRSSWDRFEGAIVVARRCRRFAEVIGRLVESHGRLDGRTW